MYSPFSTANSKPEKCVCGVPFARRVSWTKENSGSRFKTCVFYDPDRYKLEEKRQLATEVKILTSRVCCLEHEKEQALY